MNPAPTAKSGAHERLAFVALLAGATGIGFAPIPVRLSEVGPTATAFYRLLLALPILGLWMIAGNQSSSRQSVESHRAVPALRPAWRFVIVAGLCFTGDLAIWHWSLKLTTVANSTLLTNFAPFFVVLGARLLLGERISGGLVAGLLVAFAGGALLVGHSLRVTTEHVLGDALALVTAVFYAGYLVTVKHLRRTWPTARIMFWSGMVTCPALLVVALLTESRLLPTTAKGWGILMALACVSHLGGQGLIAYALAHLPASFSAVSLLWQPVVAALLAWWILGEPMSALQSLGGLLVLAGITLARPRAATSPGTG